MAEAYPDSTGRKLQSIIQDLHNKKRRRNIMITVIVMALIIAAVIYIYIATAPYALGEEGEKVDNPWAVFIGDEKIALVKNEKQGHEVLDQLKQKYCTSGNKVKSLEISDNVTVLPVELKRFEDIPNINETSDIVGKMVNINNTGKPLFTVSAVEEVTTTEPVRYNTEYEKTEKLEKGIKKVKTSGEKGTKTITTAVSMENGKIVSSKVIKSEITKKAVNKVVLKGTKDPEKTVEEVVTSANRGAVDRDDMKGFSDEKKGETVVAYAKQFLGNPYVYGGTSLTNGIDCSGFTMKIYEKFGISLPHSSGAQASCGKGVSYEEAKPGDLICYSGHVAMYMGDGKIIHASTPSTGIVISSNAKYRNIVAIRRIMD